MPKNITACLVPSVLVLTAISASGQALGNPAGPRELRVTASTRPDNLKSIQHKEAALALAGSDPVLLKTWAFFCTPTRYNVPRAELEPTRVFDNLYAIPSSPEQQTIVWAITTSGGIILIDAGQEGRTEAIVASMRKMGLNPADVRYILLGHGHGDHFGGARYFQATYGTRVGAGAGDWDIIEAAGIAGGNSTPPPSRDVVLEEGMPVRLGDQTVHIVEIPGHTPGSLAFIFNVRDNKETHTAGLFGGTILDQPRIDGEGLNQYLESIAHYQGVARQRRVNVEIQNHALFDDTPGRLARLRARRRQDPHPFLMGADEYLNLWNLVSECIRAEIARRPDGTN